MASQDCPAANLFGNAPHEAMTQGFLRLLRNLWKYADLKTLPDHLLRDIALTRGDVQ